MINNALFSVQTYKKHLAIALKAHKTQVTPHGLPYAFHVVSVATEVISALTYENLTTQEADIALACALLHDVIEDTEYDLKSEDLDPKILAGIQALTKDKSLPSQEQMPDSIKRLQHLPPYIQMVKIADRITNLDVPPPHWNEDKKRKYKAQAQNICDGLKSPTMHIHGKLQMKIDEYDKYFD